MTRDSWLPPAGSHTERRRFQLLLLVALFLIPSQGAMAQEPQVEIRVPEAGETQELRLLDGSTLFGRVTRAGNPFTFELLSGVEIEISASQVSSLETARGNLVDGDFWRDDPNGTRLFFGPTARSLRRGTGYLAVYQIIMPFLGVGVTDNLILAGGTPLIFGDGGSRPFWLAPKYTFFATERTQVAAGVLAFVVDDHSAGILYGVMTRGGPRASATFGLGYGYVDDDLAGKPAVMFGGEIRGGESLKLVTENYLFPDGGGILSVGPRFFGDRLSADLGLMIPFGWDHDLFVLPLVNFVWNF